MAEKEDKSDGVEKSNAVFDEKEKRASKNIPLKDIFLGELNERLDPGDIDGLAKSIAQVGVLEPLLVRPVSDKFEVIAGGRRYRAALQAGVKSVPCVVKEMDDISALKASFHENEERKSASPLEYGMLCWKLAQRAESIKDVADNLGKTQTWVESRINAYELYRKANIKLTEKGPGGKYLGSDNETEPTLGIVDANQIMQVISSPSVKRYMARMGGDREGIRNSLVRGLSEEYPKLNPQQRKKLMKLVRQTPETPMKELAERVIREPVGIKISLSFNAESSEKIQNEAQRNDQTVENWIRKIVMDYVRAIEKEMNGKVN
ncbi:MAG: ParB/RepB/Spo0J family partition protein [Thermoplasmataceae archaeon]